MELEKIRKLVTVAKMYYEDDLNQSQIAQALGVSRPLVSIYLSEAKELGIVDIRINSPLKTDNDVLDILCNTFNLEGGMLVNGVNLNSVTEQMIVKAACDFIEETAVRGDFIGIGWGNMIGDVVRSMETQGHKLKLDGSSCSLVGNSVTANRNYHTDELCRAFAHATGCTPYFALAPAFYETNEDLSSVSELDFISKTKQSWNNINLALLSIENYPSVPDLATASRFGSKIKDAVGHMLSYYYDIDGNIIESENDIVFRIPLEQLKKANVVMGVCGCSVTAENLIGALKTGILTHIFVDHKIAKEVVKTLA